MFDFEIEKLEKDGFIFCNHQHVLERGDEILIMRKDGEIIKAEKQKPALKEEHIQEPSSNRTRGNSTHRHNYMHPDSRR